ERHVEDDDRPAVRDEGDGQGARERGDGSRPRPGGVHHPAPGDLAVGRHDGGCASMLDAHPSHLHAEALLDPAPARLAQVAPEERVNVDVAVLREEHSAVEALGEEHRDARCSVGRREELEPRAPLLDQGRHLTERAPDGLAEEDHDARGVEERRLGETRGGAAQEAGAPDLQLLERRDRIELGQDGRAAPGGVRAGLALALEEEDVGYAALGEEVGERGPGDPAADHDDFEGARHGGTTPRADPSARTSSTSRSPSPRSWGAGPGGARARPGKRTRWGATSRKGRPSSIIAPHDGSGGGAPTPRKERLPSATIAPAMPNVACTRSIGAARGRRWRETIRKGVA